MSRFKKTIVLVQSILLALTLWPVAPAYAKNVQGHATQNTATADTITVTFNNGDGASSRSTLKLNQTDVLGKYGTLQKPSSPTRANKGGIRYEFDKWLFEDGTDAFGDQNSIQLGGTKDVTLMAQWTEYLAEGYQLRIIYKNDFKISNDTKTPLQTQVKGATSYDVEPTEPVSARSGSARNTIPATGDGDQTGDTEQTAEPVARIGETSYETLEAAISAAQAGDTVILLQDYTLPSTLTIDKSITLNLNGKTITCECRKESDQTTKKRIEIAQSANVIITNGSIANSVNLSSTAPGIAMIKNQGNLTLENVSITSDDTCIWANAGTLNIDNTVTITSEWGNAVATNGMQDGERDSSTAVVNIRGGNITSTNDVAVYVPAGTFNISGGNIIGATGVYMKGGTLSITGGNITGNGSQAAYQPSTDGSNPTGDALVIDVCGYPYGKAEDNKPAITVTGGTFTNSGANTKSVGSYAKNGYTAKTGFLSGGEYSSQPDANLLATGFSLVNSDGKWTVNHIHAFDYTKPEWTWRRINEAWSASVTYQCSCGATETNVAHVVESAPTEGTKTITATDEAHNTNTIDRTESVTYTIQYDSQSSIHDWGDLVTLTASDNQPKQWRIGDRVVADGRSSYTFAVTENATVTTTDTTEKQSTAVISSALSSNESGKATFNVKWSLPTGAIVNSATVYHGHTTTDKAVSSNAVIAHGAKYEIGLNVRNGDHTFNLTDLTSDIYQHMVMKIDYTIYGEPFSLISGTGDSGNKTSDQVLVAGSQSSGN